MIDDYDRLVATARLQERVRIAKEMNGWMAGSSAVGFLSRVSEWINEVTREAKAATAESAENSACTDGDSE